jgi:hypothetical protein
VCCVGQVRPCCALGLVCVASACTHELCSAGTTTSEVTVPIVLAIGLGIGKAINVQDTFGILSMASVFPIISVLVAGIGRRIKKGVGVMEWRDGAGIWFYSYVQAHSLKM